MIGAGPLSPHNPHTAAYSERIAKLETELSGLRAWKRKMEALLVASQSISESYSAEQVRLAVSLFEEMRLAFGSFSAWENLRARIRAFVEANKTTPSNPSTRDSAPSADGE